MKIHIHNRKQIEVLAPRENTWVFSIYTPGDKPANILPGWEVVQRMCFSDIAGDNTEMMLWVRDLRESGREVILFDSELANDVREFIAMARYEGKDIVVHCDAGVSRSQAVARFAREVFGYDAVSHTIQTDMHCNGLVIRHLNRLIWQSGGTPFEKGSYTWEPEENDYE